MHGNVSVYERFVKRCIDTAKKEQAGLVILHSHPPQAKKWQEMSRDDFDLERSYSGYTKGMTKKPLVGMTIAGGDKTWSGRVWEKVNNTFEPMQVKNIRTIRDNVLVVSTNPYIEKKYIKQKSQERTIETWGEEAQTKLINLRIGILGLGSVGSVVAELLARMGVTDFVLIDDDLLEEKNLDRHISSARKNIKMLKTKIVSNRIKSIATAVDVSVIEVNKKLKDSNNVTDLLDCDFIFCCADSDVGRHISNVVSFEHLIPVIDGGVGIETSDSGIKSVKVASRLLTGDKRCLECQEQYDISKVNEVYDQIEYIKNSSINGVSAAPYSFLAGTLAVNHFVSLIFGKFSLKNNNILLLLFKEESSEFREDNDKSCSTLCAIKNRKIEYR